MYDDDDDDDVGLRVLGWRVDILGTNCKHECAEIKSALKWRKQLWSSLEDGFWKAKLGVS